jgi:hypothetical protein
MDSDIIPRHGSVTRGQTRVIDPAAHVITRAWTAANGGTRIPRLTDDYDPLLKGVERARATKDGNLSALEAQLEHHQCPGTFCAMYNPDAAANDRDHEDAEQLCQRLPGTEGNTGRGHYRSAVLPWQKTVAEYAWGSRRSLLLEAGTGTGKTVVAAYAIQLMQFIDRGQGHFLGGDQQTTNIAIMVMSTNQTGGAETLRDNVFSKLADRASNADVTSIRNGQIRGVGAKPALEITSVLESVVARMRTKAFALEAPGRLFFAVYPADPSGVWKSDEKHWDWFVNSVQSKFLILDEIQFVPLMLLLAILEARDRSSAAHAANSATVISSPTVLMMSATPCGGGILHFSNMLLCLDNNDSGSQLSQGLRWPTIARELASNVVHNGSVGPPDVLPLLRELGLTVRSIVQVGDKVILAGGSAIQTFVIMLKSWDKASGLELVELERVPMDGQPVNDNQALWWPALMCIRADANTRMSDVTLWYARHPSSDQQTHSLAVTESTVAFEGKKPMAQDYIECCHCDVVSVAGPETLWAHSSVGAQALAVVLDLSGSVTSPILDRLSARFKAMQEEPREKAKNQLIDAIQEVLRSTVELAMQVDDDANEPEMIHRVRDYLEREIPPEPGFVSGTEGFFLGHAAFAELDKTHLFPSALFHLMWADPTTPPSFGPKETAWIRKHFSDVDMPAVAACPEYQEIAKMLWGTAENHDAWDAMNATVEPGNKEGGIGGLQRWDWFQRKVEPWMPWALSMVFAAMYTARRRGLPALYYCYLTPNGDNFEETSQAANEMIGRGAMYQLYGNDRLFPRGTTNKWTNNVRAAIIVAQRALLPLEMWNAVSTVMVTVLAAFYPKALKFVDNIDKLQRVVFVAPTPLRFVTNAYFSLRANDTYVCVLVNTPSEAQLEYIERARKSMIKFAALTFKGSNVPDDLFVNSDSVAAVEQGLLGNWDRVKAMSDERSVAVVCELAGAVGDDFPDYEFMCLATPPKSQDLLNQTLGRIRRFQGLCNSRIRPRVVRYMVMCDTNGSDTRELSTFKTLAKPVSAAQLHAGSTGSRGGRLSTPITAWQVIQKAVQRGNIAATDEVPTFGGLDFASHALKSRDCVAYMKLTMATYNWKNVVASSAHEFGVIGPRDLDLAVAGDAVYYECLAEPLDADLARSLNNVFSLEQLADRGVFLPTRGTSPYLSTRILARCTNNQVSTAAVEHLMPDVGDLVRYIMLGGPAPADLPAWPAPDESTILRQVLMGNQDLLGQLGWTGDDATAMNWLYQVLHILANGKSSTLLNEDGAKEHKCGETSTVDQGHARFHGKLQTVDESNFGPAVELMSTAASVDNDNVLERLQMVASGRADPQSVWVWPCVQALEASVVARVLVTSLDTMLSAELDGQTRKERMLNFVDGLIETASTHLNQLSNAQYKAWQVVPTGRAYLNDDMPIQKAMSMLQCLSRKKATYTDELRAAPDIFTEERLARGWLVRALRDGPVRCAVFAQNGSEIWLPCRNTEAAFSACCTQTRDESKTPTSEQVEQLRATVTGTLAPGSMRELAIGQDVFRAAITIDGQPETWSGRLDSWIDDIIQITTPVETEVPDQQHYRFPVHRQQNPDAMQQQQQGTGAAAQDVKMGPPPAQDSDRDSSDQDL